MGRRFTAASSEREYYGAAGLAGFNFTHGTLAAMVNFVTFVTAGTIFATNDQTNPSLTLYTASTSSEMRLFDGVTDNAGMTALATGVTYLLGFTKATGTATARYHVYRADTNAWTHGAFGGTNVNGATTTSMCIGSYANSNATDALNAEVFTVGAWQGLVMTDQEFQRLAAGNWPNLGVDFCEQWNDGDDTGDSVGSIGRYRCRQTARTGTTKGTAKPLAGFRFATQGRRR